MANNVKKAAFVQPSAALGPAAIALAPVGATAVGAFAIGAVAIGVLAIGRFVVGSGRFKRLEIDELVVGRLTFRD